VKHLGYELSKNKPLKSQRISRPFYAVVLGMSLAGCATVPDHGHHGRGHGAGQHHAMAHDGPPVFSMNPVSAGLPAGWVVMSLGRNKKPTEYRLRRDPASGHAVLHASASKAASGLLHPVNVKVAEAHALTWRWKVYQLIGTADNNVRHLEDAPARVVLSFAGDKSRLGFRDQMMMEHAKLLTGHDMPYATLMYIWANRLPAGTVLHNPNTGRVRMMVVESGPKRLGRWLTYTRDVRSDFRKAFGEEPGNLTAIGVLTDTDNTGEWAEAYYGDIRLSPGHD